MKQQFPTLPPSYRLTNIRMPLSPSIAETLHEKWEFFDPAQSRWLPAVVPGCIHEDLLRHRLIPDPFYGRNELALGWIDETDWKYRLHFELSADGFRHECTDLVFEGLDTVAEVRLNGSLVLESDNMFHRHRIPAKGLLVNGKNEIEITFRSASAYTATHRTAFKPPTNFNDPKGESVRIRKQPCQFGWDWGPRLITAGIWRPVRLECWSRNRIESARITQRHSGESVEVGLYPELAREDSSARFRATISLDGATVARADGPGTNLQLPVACPSLWWPAGQGAQPLYEVRVELFDGDAVLDCWCRRIGLRTIELDRKPDEYRVEDPGGQALNRFGFRVNGRLIFAKGANWIPAHSFVHGLGRADYEPLLQSAVEAHMNTVRLWGGGIYEHDCFFDLCDELGLLVWHDFMFACDLYPSDEPFLASVQREAEENVARVRHHAALALWCGNNEIAMLNHGPLKPGAGFVEGYEKLFHQILPNVVRKIDGTTPYLRSSPDVMLPERPDTRQPSHDVHDWKVWHDRFPVEHYESTKIRFASEFGMQSYPSPETASGFCPPQELNIFSPTFDCHQKNVAGNQIIFDYISRLFRFPKDYRAAAYLSQLNQAWCMKIAVEHWRRSSPMCLGAMYWQLNDCWPVASWSSLEFGGKWKALHHEARRFFAPELVSIQHLGREKRGVGNYAHSDTGPVRIHVVQDTPERQSYRLQRRLCQLDGTVLDEASSMVETIPQRGIPVETVDYTETVERTGRDRVYLCVRLLDNEGGVRAQNYGFFTAPRSLQLQAAPIRIQKQITGEAEWVLTLESEEFQYAVCLELEGRQTTWSDNFFHLPPREKKSVKVQWDRPPGTEQFSNLRAYSLADCSG